MFSDVWLVTPPDRLTSKLVISRKFPRLISSPCNNNATTLCCSDCRLLFLSSHGSSVSLYNITRYVRYLLHYIDPSLVTWFPSNVFPPLFLTLTTYRHLFCHRLYSPRTPQSTQVATSLSCCDYYRQLQFVLRWWMFGCWRWKSWGSRW
jgi:hypothetical protein